MKLIAIAFPESPRGLRPALNYLEIGKTAPYMDWKVHIRGGSVFLVSPPGWKLGSGIDHKSELRRVFEIPRANCVMQWEVEKEHDFDLVEQLPVAPVKKPAKAEAVKEPS